MKGTRSDVTICGVLSDGGDPASFSVTRVTVDTSGFLTANLVLAGSTIFSMNPFSPEFNVETGVLDMVPVVNFAYLCGPLDDDPEPANIFGRMKYMHAGDLHDPTSALLVAQMAPEFNHDAPAVDTQAQIASGALTDQYAVIQGFGFTVTAVAAIAAPINVVLADQGGTTLWSGRVLVPAGQSKEVWIEGPFSAFEGFTLTVPAPGATNFVTASIAYSVTGDPPS